MHTRNLSMSKFSESHVIHIPTENKVIKFYWDLSKDDIERYAALHNYLANFWESTTLLIVNGEEDVVEYRIIIEILRLNWVSAACSYLYHKSWWEKRVKRVREVLAVEQKYIEWWMLLEFEQFFKENLFQCLIDLWLKFDIDWLTTANFRAINEWENIIRFVITDLATNIKSLVRQNSDFIDMIMHSTDEF